MALALALIAFAAGCQPTTPTAQAPTPAAASLPQHLPTAMIRIGDVPLRVEVADTNAVRLKGMMFREKLGPDEAMLFVFLREDNLAFWMRNTLVDLDLAFIAADGRITAIEPMVALNTESVYSREPAKYVLEAPRGWFAAHGIREGAKVAIPPDVVAKD